MGFLTSPCSIIKSVLQTTGSPNPSACFEPSFWKEFQILEGTGAVAELQEFLVCMLPSCTALLWSVGIHEIGFIDSSLFAFLVTGGCGGGNLSPGHPRAAKMGAGLWNAKGQKIPASLIAHCGNSSIDLMKCSMSEQLLVKLDLICPVTRTLLSLRHQLPSRSNVAGVARLSPCPRGALALCRILWLTAPWARRADVGLRFRVLRMPARILEGTGRRARVPAAVLAPAPSPAPGDSLAGGIASFSLDAKRWSRWAGCCRAGLPWGSRRGRSAEPRGRPCARSGGRSGPAPGRRGRRGAGPGPAP